MGPGRQLRHSIVLLLLLASAVLEAIGAPLTLRAPVHPRRNVEEFAPVEARYVRFLIRATNRGEPCLDELEIYPADDASRNVALAANGARATASGSLPGYAIHQLEGVNDGRYGNSRSWIADRVKGAWVQIELPSVLRINRVVWGRDREGNFIDRLATDYEIQVATETNHWQTVAGSAGREPLPAGAQNLSGGSITRSLQNRFVPSGTTLSTESGQSSAEYRIDVWQTADGLPGNTVTAIQQTPDGYLWIGTLNGLVRFDGIRFVGFGADSILQSVRVMALLAARDGSLWIGTDGAGLVRLRDGVSTAYDHTAGLGSDTVMALAEDAGGGIWVGTAGGLKLWRDGTFVPRRLLAGRGASDTSVVTVDAAGAVWATVANQLLMTTNGSPLARSPANEPSAFSSVLTAVAGRSGQVWFGGANGYIGAVSNGVVHVFREQPGQLLEAIWALCETRGGDVWAGTANGGLRRLSDGRFYSVTTQEGLSDNSVRCVVEDREGNLWVGTVGGGLNRVKLRKVTTYTTRDGLAHNVVMSLAEDRDGTVWIGSNCGGLTVRSNGVFTPFYANYVLDNECIWSLLAGRDGAVWAGTWGGGLFEVRGREVKHFQVLRQGDDEPVTALCDDGTGGLWIGTMAGGVKRFRDGHISAAFSDPERLTHPVTALLWESESRLWIGTGGGGLALFENGRLNRITRRDGLPSDAVRTIYRDSGGTLWIGTGGGLATWKNRIVHAFTRACGLPDEVISQILEDDRGNLWFGCNQGIFRVARSDFDAVAAGRSAGVTAIPYGRAEGMESLECTGGFSPAGLRTRDGRLWFSTVKGLVMVDPAVITRNEPAPPVVVEEVTADGVPLSLHDNQSDGFEIVPGVQRIEFRFTALSLVAPERNRFKYRLEGLEKDWVDAGHQRSTVYTHLPPGHYQFRVTACNNDGVWNESGASVRVSVRPRLWQTWWFRAGLVLALLAGGGWLVRITAVHRLRRKLRRLEEQHALEKERSRIAQDIHDELGANLTRIALLTEVGQKHRDQPQEVAADLGKISATAREAVRAMDAIVWAVNPRNDSLDHFANYVSQFTEEFLRPTAIRCRLDIPADLPERPISTEARHHLFLAVKEALNNVVRHSGASEVCVRLKMENNELSVAIEDNGRGIVAPVGGEHDGLGNIRRRLEGLGGRFAIESSAASGTSLILRLPLAHSGKDRST